MLGLHPYFYIRHNYDGRFVSSTQRPHLTLNEILWYSFLLEAECNPGLLKADRSITSLETLQGPHRELNPGLPSCGAVPYPRDIAWN